MSHDFGNVYRDETLNADTKLDDILTEGISMMWNVYVELLLLDSTMLSLDDDHLYLRYKICAVLVLMKNHYPCEGNRPDHHGATSAF